jgi:hypothetical protein
MEMLAGSKLHPLAFIPAELGETCVGLQLQPYAVRIAVTIDSPCTVVV